MCASPPPGLPGQLRPQTAVGAAGRGGQLPRLTAVMGLTATGGPALRIAATGGLFYGSLVAQVMDHNISII